LAASSQKSDVKNTTKDFLQNELRAMSKLSLYEGEGNEEENVKLDDK
jgi:hypothetical protein